MSISKGSQPLFVGHFFDGQDWQFLPVTERDAKRAMRAYLRVLDSFSLPPGSRALVIANYDDWAMTIPLEMALTASKITIFNADASPFEAGRIESFIRRFDPGLIIGVDAGVLQGLDSAGHDLDRLFSGRSVWTRDAGSYERLSGKEGSSNVYRWNMLGPAVAMECREACGLHVDGEEWDLQVQDGEVLVSSRLGREPALQSQRTGVSGSLEEGICACGNADPRFIAGS